MDVQIKEKMRIALILALNAGFMDGFSFFHFDGRFIGAQTGNLIQAGIKLAQGDFINFLNFAVPILFFMLGVMTRGFYSHYLLKKHRFDVTYLLILQWLGVTIFSIIYGVGVQIPALYYVAIFSYFMAIQYDTFTKTHGLVYGSIIMTGNMKSLSASLTQFFITHEKKHLRTVGLYSSLIGIFFLGIIGATVAIHWFGDWTLLTSSVLLGCAYFMMRLEMN